MRRAPALFVVVGVAVGLTGLPVQAQTQSTDGFWVSLAAGTAGSSTSSAYNEFWFDSPHAPPISVTSATGTGTVQATTAGGTSFFTPGGVPVLLPTTDGYATLSSGSSFPSSAIPRFAGGSQASGAPQAGGSVPSGADTMSMSMSAPSSNGSQTLTVTVSSPTGTQLGSTSVSVPDNGWWVVGLGPGTNSSNTGGNGGTTGSSPPTNTGGNSSSGGSVSTPEPASVLLMSFAGVTAAGWRLRRRIA